MNQHPVNLLPEAIRARSLAGQRMGRFIAAVSVAVVVVVVAGTHWKLALQRAQGRLARAQEQADLVLATEARNEELRGSMVRLEGYIQQYERMASPLDLSAVIATLIDELPNSVTLDRIDLDAGSRRRGRAPRYRGIPNAEERQPRVLKGELSGFAATDRDIADLVDRLERTAPFGHVSLDFSRTRFVRGVSAREFRLSFRIDFDVSYRVELRSPEQAIVDGGEGPDVH